MRAELNEREASGEIKQIFEEIRVLCAVPYVSSLQRHLATRPGWLEWTWARLGPAFHCGVAQEAAWRLAGDMVLEPLAPIPRDALRGWMVSAQDEVTVRAVCESFIRVSPANMMFSALLKAVLSGARFGGEGPAANWRPPEALPPLPPLVAPEGLPEDEQSLLLSLRTEGEAPFVPGLYRMLANWPKLLAHLAVELAPRRRDPAMLMAGEQLRRRIDGAVPDVLRRTHAFAGGPPPPPKDEYEPVLEALTVYRQTSPEMVAFGRLIRDAMPAMPDQ